jgi:hypothetical protein
MASATKLFPLKSPTDVVFPGPRAFKVEEEGLFYGREKEASQLMDLLLTYQDVFLYAQSGAGKTSLINARLLPQLRVHNNCYVARVGGELPPGIKLDDIPNIFDYNLVASIVEDPGKIPRAPKLEEYFKASPDHDNTFLIIDQLEEIFTTYPERWEDRLVFFKHLGALLKPPPAVSKAGPALLKDQPPLHVLFAIREEYVAPMEFYSDLFPNQLHIRYHLQGLRQEEAVRAISGPLAASGFAIKKETSLKLVDKLREVPLKTLGRVKPVLGEFVEPLHLQIVCQNLIAQLPLGATISEDEITAYADVGQTLLAFYKHAVAVTVNESNVDEAMVRSWFDHVLITPAGTRGIAFQGEHETAGLPNHAVAILERESMVRGERRAGALWYELTHDRFISPIRESNMEWRQQSLLSQQVWPDSNLEGWLAFKAVEIRDNRALERHSSISKEEIVNRYLATLTPEEAEYQSKENWRQAELYLANDVLEGRFDLVRSLTPDSFHRIEGSEGRGWLTEVKTLKAYLNWEARKAEPAPEGCITDYLQACQQIRDQLLNPQRKHPQAAFEPVQKYIAKNFLTRGRLDSSKKAEPWIKSKSQRLVDLGVIQGPEKSRTEAKKQMRKFYEHISTAVLGDETKSKEGIRSVLQSLGLYRGFEHYETIVNCLEMAIAIYFLDPERIKKVLAER